MPNVVKSACFEARLGPRVRAHTDLAKSWSSHMAPTCKVAMSAPGNGICEFGPKRSPMPVPKKGQSCIFHNVRLQERVLGTDQGKNAIRHVLYKMGSRGTKRAEALSLLPAWYQQWYRDAVWRTSQEYKKGVGQRSCDFRRDKDKSIPKETGKNLKKKQTQIEENKTANKRKKSSRQSSSSFSSSKNSNSETSSSTSSD